MAGPNDPKAESKTNTEKSAILGFEQGEYPYAQKLKTSEYEAEKAALQAELLKVQLWAQQNGEKFVLLFEGRDAAGFGVIRPFVQAGTINWR